MTEQVQKLLEIISTSPGCYLMHDKSGVVIYVGKAKNLKNRVTQYFYRPHFGKVGAMVSHVEYFETILTKTEQEAFILELNLIHKYMPRYNILLKDNKHYPYIAIKKEGYPVVKLLRNTKNNQYFYYGPYPNSGSAFKIVELLNELYPLRKCNKLPNKPCLYYSMGECLAPCINKNINYDEISKINDEIKSFLSGKTYKKEQELLGKIKIASENLNFEQAEKYKELLLDIKNIKPSQSVDLYDESDHDLFAYVVRDSYVALSLFIYRNGVLLGKDVILSEVFDDNDVGETISSLIFQFYENRDLPIEIDVFSEDLYNNLTEVFANKIHFVQKGKLYDILPLLIKNAKKALDDYFMSSKLDNKKEETLEKLGNILSIPFPSYIELFDNSHISGYDAVGVSVSFVNGEPCKKLYRKYKLTNNNTKDDLSNMKEVLTRRYERIISENAAKPDLILLDGGITQLEIALSVFKKLNLQIPFFGLFKNDKHETKGIVSKDGEVFPIDSKSDVFYLITNMQNEVHRFAISYFRNSHSKTMVTSVLDGISGLGRKRMNILYDTYKDIKQMETASIEELSQLIPSEVAKNVYQKLHKKGD